VGRADPQGAALARLDDELQASVEDRVTRLSDENATLRERNRLLEEIVRVSPAGMALVAPDGTWLAANSSLCELLGYSETEILARTFQDITHPDDLDTDLEYVRQTLAGEIDSYQMEKRYNTRDGQVVWVLLGVSLQRDSGGNPLYFIAQAQNISDRKQTEAEMRRQEDRLRWIVDTQQQIALSDLDLDLIMRIAIERAQQLTGAETVGIGLVDNDDLVFKGVSDPSAAGSRVKIANSLAGEAIRSKQLLLSGDISQDPRSHADAAALPDSKSLLSVPLLHDGSAVGIVSIASPRLHAFTERDSETMQLVAGQLSAAISRALQREAGHALLTMRTEAFERLQEREERFRAITVTASDSIVMIDEAGKIVMVNPAALAVFGYIEGELVGQSLVMLMPERLREGHLEGFGRYLKSGEKHISWEHIQLTGLHKDGTEIPLEISFTQFKQNGAVVFSGFMRDITERKLTEADLVHQALHDGLTGLPNRKLLLERLERALLSAARADAPVALLLMDLNGFKHVNDTFGHHHGDALLQQIAERLERSLRVSDTIARLGGDEFAILLPNTPAQGAIRASEKVALALRRIFTVEGQRLEVDGSIGIAHFPEHSLDPQELLRHADVAMYAAKRDKSGCAVYAFAQDLNIQWTRTHRRTSRGD